MSVATPAIWLPNKRKTHCPIVRTVRTYAFCLLRSRSNGVSVFRETREADRHVNTDLRRDARPAIRRQIGLLCWREGIYSDRADKTTHTHTHTHTQTAISRGSFVRQPCRHSRCRSASARRGKYRIAVREWKPEVTGTVINRPSRRQQHSATTDEVAPRPPTELSRAIVTTWLRDVASNYRSRGC